MRRELVDVITSYEYKNMHYQKLWLPKIVFSCPLFPGYLRCDCRDQCPGYQPVPNLSLGRICTETPHPQGSPSNWFEGMQTPHQKIYFTESQLNKDFLPLVKLWNVQQNFIDITWANQWTSYHHLLGIHMLMMCLMQSLRTSCKWTWQIMAKPGVDQVGDFEDVSGVTHPSPNAKSCNVVWSISLMKSKTYT